MNKYTKTINVSFTIEGEDVYEFSQAVSDYIKRNETDKLRIKLYRMDYSSYPIETKKDKKEKNND